MTIKVEQDVLLRVLETSSPSSSSHLPLDCTQRDDGYILVDFCKEKIRSSAVSDDDTLSTSSLSADTYSDTDSDFGDEPCRRRVSFAEEEVTAVWTRPSTPKADLPNLFYTNEETQR